MAEREAANTGVLQEGAGGTGRVPSGIVELVKAFVTAVMR
jgi:hypothetical protein